MTRPSTIGAHWALTVFMAAVLVASSIALLVGPASQQVRAETEADILIGDLITYTDLGVSEVDIQTLNIDSADPSRVIGVAKMTPNHPTHPRWVYGLAITTDGDTAVLGNTQALFDGSGFVYMKMALLDPSRAVFVSYDPDDNNKATFSLRILTIDEQLEFTVGAANALEVPHSIQYTYVSIAVLDSNRFVLSYCAEAPYAVYSVICTVNGDAISVGVPNALSGASEAAIVALDDDSFLVHYTADTQYAPRGGTARVATVDDDTVTYGPPTTFMVTTDVYYADDPVITALDSDSFVIASRESTVEGTLKVATIDGTTITVGEPVGVSVKSIQMHVAKLDSTHFAWKCYDIVSGDSYMGLATVDGDEITLNDSFVYPHGIIYTIVPLEPSRFGVIGLGDWDSEYPVGAICTVPSLVAAPEPPLITSTPSTEAIEGELYSYQLTADMVVDWALISGPEWLTISEGGLVSGTPDETGQFDISISATADGLAVDQNWTVTVVPQLIVTNSPAAGAIAYVVT